MPNADRPRGFELVGHVSGSPHNAAINKYAVPSGDSTALFVGDAVITDGNANADGIPYVIQGTVAASLRGVVVGFEPDPTNLELQYRLASTERICYVCDDPDALFEIQETGAIAATDVSGNAEISVAAGSTVSGRSGMELDSASAITGAAQLRIVRLAQRADNEIGTNANWIVRINEHELDTAAGT